MNVLISLIFKFIAYATFGLMTEVKFTAISNVADGDITKEDKKMRGYVPLWMIPIYGILLTFVFEPVYVNLLLDKNIFLRYLVWCVTFTGFEALTGYLYYKILKVKVWDYSNDKGAILGGFTKLPFFPLWGLAGLLIEQYVLFIMYLSPFVVVYVKGLF